MSLQVHSVHFGVKFFPGVTPLPSPCKIIVSKILILRSFTLKLIQIYVILTEKGNGDNQSWCLQMRLQSTSASCYARVNQKGFNGDFSGITVDGLVETNLSLCFRN